MSASENLGQQWDGPREHYLGALDGQKKKIDMVRGMRTRGMSSGAQARVLNDVALNRAHLQRRSEGGRLLPFTAPDRQR